MPDSLPYPESPQGEDASLADSTSPRAAPLQVPVHEVLCPIGRGSSGQVWLARNVMGTYRAVKVVYRKSFDSDRPYDREFTGIKKFEPISRSHEGFVDILQVGRNDVDGYFYYVMELADRADGVTSHQGSATREQPPATAVSPGKATAQDTEHWTPNSYSPKTLHSEIKKSGRLPVEECLQLALSLSSALGQLHKHASWTANPSWRTSAWSPA